MYSKRAVGIILMIGVVYIVGKGLLNDSNRPRDTASFTPAPVEYPESEAGYKQVDAQVGCKSTYSDQKKDDVFNANYRNHWMTWRGEIVLLESDNVSLNIDGIGTQDLQIDFADKQAGYNLSKGSKITVRFLMKTAGGCFLPFSGKEGVIL